MKKNLLYETVIAVFVFALGAWWFLSTLGEMGKPSVEIGHEAVAIGRQKEISVVFSDKGQGLRHTEVAIIQDNQRRVLSTTDYPKKKEAAKRETIAMDAAALKLHDGAAALTAVAVDYALWKNRAEASLPVKIDLLPPQVSLHTAQNYINTGGACVVAYGVSEAVAKTGVQAAGAFYSAYKTTAGGQNPYAAYFAIPDEILPGNEQIALIAVDEAGNQTLSPVPVVIRKKKIASDKIVLSDAFLNSKMPEFQSADPQLSGKTPLEVFVEVNTRLRADNLKTIQAACKKTEGRRLWNGPFLRMKNAAPRAFFGDRRTYFYNGKEIGTSVHNGVDLASLTHAPVEAANDGIIRFTGPIGIYGNSIIMDHGMGVSTLYSHLSAIGVKVDQIVKKGERIGTSGMTGLAGGDHLHFGVAINGQFVNPVEWWDPHWIADNIDKKLGNN
jgi:murein DD-endopeptidase MepM/ murein hydrolase activator NlpD